MPHSLQGSFAPNEYVERWLSTDQLQHTSYEAPLRSPKLRRESTGKPCLDRRSHQGQTKIPQASRPRPVGSAGLLLPKPHASEGHLLNNAFPRPADGGAMTCDQDDPRDPAAKYARRRRHKTRDDKYEYKGRETVAKERKNRTHSKKRTSRKKNGAALNEEFQAPNVDTARLTLKRHAVPGIFNKGKSSAPILRKDVPDLTFSEMAFLSKKRNLDDAKIRTVHEHNTQKKPRRGLSHDISAYFDVRKGAVGTKKQHSLPGMSHTQSPRSQLILAQSLPAKGHRRDARQRFESVSSGQKRHHDPEAPAFDVPRWIADPHDPQVKHFEADPRPFDNSMSRSNVSYDSWSTSPPPREVHSKRGKKTLSRHDGHELLCMDEEPRFVAAVHPRSSVTNGIPMQRKNSLETEQWKSSQQDCRPEISKLGRLYTLEDLQSLSYARKVQETEHETMRGIRNWTGGDVADLRSQNAAVSVREWSPGWFDGKAGERDTISGGRPSLRQNIQRGDYSLPEHYRDHHPDLAEACFEPPRLVEEAHSPDQDRYAERNLPAMKDATLPLPGYGLAANNIVHVQPSKNIGASISSYRNVPLYSIEVEHYESPRLRVLQVDERPHQLSVGLDDPSEAESVKADQISASRPGIDGGLDEFDASLLESARGDLDRALRSSWHFQQVANGSAIHKGPMQPTTFGDSHPACHLQGLLVNVQETSYPRSEVLVSDTELQSKRSRLLRPSEQRPQDEPFLGLTKPMLLY